MVDKKVMVFALMIGFIGIGIQAVNNIPSSGSYLLWCIPYYLLITLDFIQSRDGGEL